MTISKKATVNAIIAIRDEIRSLKSQSCHAFTSDERIAAINAIPGCYETYRALLADLAHIEETIPALNVGDIMILSTLLEGFKDQTHKNSETFLKNSKLLHDELIDLKNLKEGIEKSAICIENNIKKNKRFMIYCMCLISAIIVLSQLI